MINQKINTKTFWIDDTTSKQINQLCDILGLTIEEIIQLFIRVAVFNDKIPLEIDQNVLNKVINSRKNELSKKFNKQIQIALDKYEKKDQSKIYEKIMDDIYDIKAISKLDPTEYFELCLYDIPKEEWQKTYLSDNETREIKNILNTPVKGVDMGNKYVCYQQFKKFYDREAIQLASEKDKYDFVFFVKKHKKVILKPISGSLGLGVCFLSYDDVSDWDEYVKNILSKSCYKNGILVEEIIKQDDDIAIFNSTSVNTIRVTTLNIDNKIYTNAFMRIGVGNLIVDNVAQDGLLCSIDQETGEILRVSDKYGKEYITHPTTGVKLVGMHVPDIKGVIEQAKEVARIIPHYKYIGWDFAKTNNKWVVVEFNNKAGIVGVQSCLKKGLKKEFKQIIENNLK